MDNEEL